MRNKNKQKQTKTNGSQLTRSLKPPTIINNPVFTRKFRFLSQAAFSGTISSHMIFGVVGGIATTTTNLACIASSVRVKSIEMWAAVSPASQATVSCTFYGLNTPDIERTDTGFGSTYPAYLKANTPKVSQAGFWQINGADNNLFNLGCPGSTIIDVEVEYTMIGDQIAGALTRTQAGMSAGTYYYGRLDGYTSGLLIPVSLSNV
jgi:hypothetical protein